MSASVIVFRNGEEGYPFYRVPSLLRINSTLLLAFAEARRQRTDHGSVDLVLKRSYDEGATWITYGNPAPLYDAPEAVLFFCVENKEVRQTRSLDGGVSWSTPEPIAWAVPEEWKWVATGPPAALVTSRGRWVLPCDGLIGSRQLWKATSVFSFVLYSDDKGISWHQSRLLDGGNECQAAELSDGSLVLNMRSKILKRLQSTSHDHGETWSDPKPAKPEVQDGNCQGSMIALHPTLPLPPMPLLPSPSPSPILVATSSAIGRKGLTARTSTNGGASWSTLAVLEKQAGAYSALVDLGRGWAGCLYEAKRDKEPPSAGEQSVHQGARGVTKRGMQGGARPEDVLVYRRLNVSAAPPPSSRDEGGPHEEQEQEKDEL